jgi:hypothetical protein
MVVTWTAPTSNGGSAVTGYKLYRNSTLVNSPTSGATTYTDSGLTAGTSYSYQIVATNVAGDSTISSATSGTTRPAAATSVAGTITAATTVSVSWTASVSPVVTGYKLYYRAGTSGAFTEWTAGTNDTSPTSVTGLIAGTDYYFRVDAYVNNDSPATAFETASTVSAAVTAITTPAAPSGAAGTTGNTQIAVSWTAASATTAAPVTGYKVYYKTAAATSYTLATTSTATSYTITGLTNGTTYNVKVMSYNSAGETTLVTTDQVTTTPVTVPGAPTVGTPTGGTLSLSVVVTASATTGGETPSTYKVYVYNTSNTLITSSSVAYSSAAQTITVSGLTAGTSGTAYYVKASATNSAGESTLSAASANTTVYNVPSTPGVPTATAGSGQLAATWTLSTANNGSTITGYQISAYTASTATTGAVSTCTTANATSTTCTVSSLTNGTTYYLRSMAQNAAGYSVPSAASTPYTACAVPTAPVATGSYAFANSGSADGSVVVTIGIPTVAGNGCAVTSYMGEVLNGGVSVGTCTISGATGSTCNVSSLNSQVAYTVRSKATNSMGDSSWYSIGSLTAIGKPTIPSFSFTQGTPADQGTAGGTQYGAYTVSITWGAASYKGVTAGANPYALTCTANTTVATTELSSTPLAAATTASYSSSLVIASGNGATNTTATSRTCALTASGTANSFVKVGDYAPTATSTTYTSASSSQTTALPGYAYPYPYPSHYPSHYGGHYPAHYSGHYPAHYSGHYPVHYSGHYPVHYSGHYPVHYGGHYPAHYGGHYPRHYGAHYPRHYGAHYPAAYYPPNLRRY